MRNYLTLFILFLIGSVIGTTVGDNKIAEADVPTPAGGDGGASGCGSDGSGGGGGDGG